MRFNNLPFNVLLVLLIISFSAKSQGTFSLVHQVLQNNCATSGCHDASSAAGLNFTLNESDVYNQLVNKTPANATALSKDNMLVKPGYVTHSFLYRKIASNFDAMVRLDTTEKAALSEHSQLFDNDLELIRQWIQYSAPLSDTVADKQLINDFHYGLGMPLIEVPQSPEDQGLEGMQFRIGPLLLNPNQEVEFFHKFKANLKTDKEVYRMEAIFDNQSHHFVIYDFKPSSALTYPEGPQDAGSYSAQIPIHFGASELNAWNVSRDDVLPTNTAYFWDTSTTIVLDYHVRNYSATEILGATAYINIYTRDKQPQTKEMKMEFPVYGDLNPFILKIPPTGEPYKQEFFITKENEIWDIWKIQGHTHLLGVDFDMYKRNPDGTRGEQIYEGHYNADYSFVQGFFDNQHAPVRTIENPFLEVDMNHGIILEATYLNNTADTIKFGLTTKDEMFAAYLTYTSRESASSILEFSKQNDHIAIYPNPTSNDIKIALKQADKEINSLKVYSVLGDVVFQKTYKQSKEINLTKGTLLPGVYFVEVNNQSSQQSKIIVY